MFISLKGAKEHVLKPGVRKMEFTCAETARSRENIMKRSSPRRDSERDRIMRLIFSQRGLAVEIARHLGVTHQNVASWNRVPAHHVNKIAPLIKKSPEYIRPDIFVVERRRQR
jgi:hypothetical protein